MAEFQYLGHPPYVTRAAAACNVDDPTVIDRAGRLLPLTRLSSLVAQAIHNPVAPSPGTLDEIARHLAELRVACCAAELIAAEVLAAFADDGRRAIGAGPIGYEAEPDPDVKSGRPVDGEPPENLVSAEPTRQPAPRRESRAQRA